MAWEVLLLFGFTLVRGRETKKAVFKWIAVLLSLYGTVVTASAFSIELARAGYRGNRFNSRFVLHDPYLAVANQPGYSVRQIQLDGDFLTADARQLSLAIDSEGFRNDTPVPERIDIAYLGDSFTFAQAVSLQEAYPALVSRELRLEGRNYGISLTGQGIQRRVLQKYVLPKKPRIVVLQYFDNDGMDNLWFLDWERKERTQAEKERWIYGREDWEKTVSLSDVWSGKPVRGLLKVLMFRPTDRSQGFKLDFSGKSVHFYHPPVYSLKPQFAELPLPLGLDLAGYAGQPQDREAVIRHVVGVFLKHYSPPPGSRARLEEQSHRAVIDTMSYGATRRFLEKIIEECRAIGAEVLMVRIASAWFTYAERMVAVEGTPSKIAGVAGRSWPGRETLDKLLESVCTSKGVRFVSTLREWPQAGEFYYMKYDGHLNAPGHKALAELIVRELRKSGWLEEIPESRLRK